MNNAGSHQRTVWRGLQPAEACLVLGLCAAAVLWGSILITGVHSLNLELFMILLAMYGTASAMFVLWRMSMEESFFHAPVYITVVAFVEFGLAATKTFGDSNDLERNLHGNYNALLKALVYVAVGMVAFWGGSAWSTRLPAVKSFDRRIVLKPKDSVLVWAVLLYSVALCAKLYLLHANMYSYTSSSAAYYSNLASAQVLNVASYTGIYVLVIAAIERFSHPTDLPRRVFFTIIFGSECFWGVISGMKSVLLLNFVVAGVVSSLLRRKVQLRWIVAVICLLVVIYPFYEHYRVLVRSRHVTSATIAIELVGKAVKDVVQGTSNSEIVQGGSERVTSRLRLLDSVALMMSMGPRLERLQGDEELWMLPFYPFVPRLLWPSKPVLNKGQRLSEILGTGQMSSTAVTYPGDLILLYGMPGLLVGMFAFGAFTQWMTNKVASVDKRWLFIYACIFPLETDLEMDAFSLWTNLIKSMLIVAMLAYVVYPRPTRVSTSAGKVVVP